MRENDMEIPITARDDMGRRPVGTAGDASLGELFKRLTSDTADLVRHEAALAKAELRETGSVLAADGAKIGAAAGLALAGALSLTAFLVLVLGNLFGGAYWLSALIVGAVMLVVGALLARNAVNDVKRRGLAPRQTIATLREDKAWARHEARDLKHELTTDPTASPTQKAQEER